MPVTSPSAAPTPEPAPEGGEVLAAGRARGLAAKNRNQPPAFDLTSVSGHGGYACAAAEVVSGPFHTKRQRPTIS